MKVLDQEPYAWILFEYDNDYILSVNCNHSAFGYTLMIELNDKEYALFESEGRTYLTKLAHDVHYSAPAIKNSTSVYKGRDVTRQYGEACTEAIEVWRSSEKNA